MFEFLRRLFGSSRGSSSDETTIPKDIGIGRDTWTWEHYGEYPYDYYTDAIEEVKQLKREKKHDEVEDLLMWCIEFVEAEAEHEAGKERGIPSIAPAYYRHLAIVYRKDNRYDDEVSIIERYVDACEEVGNEPQDGMLNRLEKARSKAADD